MGSLTDYAENALLDHLFNSAYTASPKVYLALCTADPTDTATGAAMNEHPDAANYGRAQIQFAAAASRKVTQSAEVSFSQASATYTTITHYAILSTSTYGAGNALAHGAFSSEFCPVSGNTPKVAASQVYVQINASQATSGFNNYTVHKLLDLIFRNQAFSKPSTYLALLAGTCADDNATLSTLSEVTGTSYTRQAIYSASSGSSPAWASASGGSVQNAGAATWTVGGADWDEIQAMAIVTTLSGAANVLCYDNANVVNQTPGNGDTVQFAAGAIDIKLT